MQARGRAIQAALLGDHHERPKQSQIGKLASAATVYACGTAGDCCFPLGARHAYPDRMQRTWLITGSSKGFGQALAIAALNAGDRVVATAAMPRRSTISLLPRLSAAWPSRWTSPTVLVDAAVDAAIASFGAIDVLVNNAGLASVGAVEELDEDQHRSLMDTMYFGPIAMIQAVLPGMRNRRGGTIVQMSSMGGQVSMPGFGAYCGAKFGLEAISEALAAEVAPFGIRVLIVEPGAFATSFGGGRAQTSPDSGHYDATVGPQRAAVEGMDGSSRAIPIKPPRPS